VKNSASFPLSSALSIPRKGLRKKSIEPELLPNYNGGIDLEGENPKQDHG
jgi:hypothetical protein